MLGYWYGKRFSLKIAWAYWLRLFSSWTFSHINTPTFLNLVILHTYTPMKMEQTECFETSAYKIQTPVNYPEETILYLSEKNFTNICNELSDVSLFAGLGCWFGEVNHKDQAYWPFPLIRVVPSKVRDLERKKWKSKSWKSLAPLMSNFCFFQCALEYKFSFLSQ